MSDKQNILNKEPVNGGRQLEIDITKGLAVFFMIAVHIMYTFSNKAVESSAIGTVVDFFGDIPAAPVFMFLMGIGIVYSRKHDSVLLVKRGLMIFVLGYILNLLSSTIPFLIKYFATSQNYYLVDAINNFISVDILQFAGLALIFFGFIKQIKLNSFLIVITAIVLCIINAFLLNIKTDNFILDGFTGLLWGSCKTSYFPFLTWLPYPIAGYFFGKYLIQTSNKNFFYKKSIFLSLVIILIFFTFSNKLFHVNILDVLLYGDEYLYYHHGLLVNIFFISFVIFWVGIIYFTTKIIPKFIDITIIRWSKNVTVIYFIHLLLICWLSFVIGENIYGLTVTTIIFIIITMLSDFLAFLYVRTFKKTK
jgi:uncharacterized membrane protein